jgi:8-oxo-dGTP pyrophosphatase MutT (NUDIX family)
MYELETADEGAVREFVEEAGSLPVGRVVGRHVAEQGDGAWAYTTVIYEVDEQFEPDENWESSGGRWLTVDEVAELDLHPGFASAWPVLRDGGDPVEEEPFDLFEGSPDDAPAWEGGDLPDPTEKAITEPSDPTGSEKDFDDLMKEQWGDHRKRLYEWMMTTGVDPLSSESFLLAGGTEGDRESVYTAEDYEFPSGFSSLEEAVTVSDERDSGPLLKKFTARLLAQKLLEFFIVNVAAAILVKLFQIFSKFGFINFKTCCEGLFEFLIGYFP